MPAYQPSRLVEVPPAPCPAPTLTARIGESAGKPTLFVTLSKPLVSTLPMLRAGAPVELVPPRQTGGTWHLDCRPTAGRRLPGRPGSVARFTSAYAVRRDLFIVPLVGAGTARILDSLTFALGPEVTPGYYALLPVR